MSDSKPLHILVVEDHDDSRAALSNLLSHCGYWVSTAANVKEAFASLDNLHFDVLLSDIGLPDGTGLDVVVEAKRRQALTGIALTAWDTDQDIERGKRAGFDHYLTKPLDFHRLRCVLAKIN